MGLVFLLFTTEQHQCFHRVFFDLPVFLKSGCDLMALLIQVAGTVTN